MEMSSIAEKEKTSLGVKVHLMAGWPILMLLIGGAVGAVLGIVAYVINLKIYKSELSQLQKVLANLMCGMFAMMLWWSIASWIQASL